MIVVWPTSGLCNRLRVISSFRVLAQYANREFAVCWTPGTGFSDERLEDLFEHDIRVVGEREFDVLSSRALRLHEMVTIEGAGKERTWTWEPGASFEQVFDPAIPVVVYKGFQRCDYLLAHDVRAHMFGDGFTADYDADVRTWRPVRRIRRAVDRVAAGFGANTVGVHIRRGDAWHHGARPAYRRSPDAAFMAAMDRELEADPDTTFFLATDAADTEERFRERYGSALLTNRKKTFVASNPGEPKENQRDAVIDLFALARTRRVLGSHFSSFSKFAAVLGAVPYHDIVEGADTPVPDRIRLRRTRAGPREPRDTVASFAINQVGLGHTSRLVAAHDELRGRGLSSAFFVEHEKQMIEDYRFDQTVIPRFRGVFRDQQEVTSRARDLARTIVELALEGTRPFVLHDVFVHRALYDAAVDGGWPQALIYRARRDVEDPASWLRTIAPAVSVVFEIGKDGFVREDDDISVYGVDDVVRKPLGEMPLWGADPAELRIMITAGGGGRPDSEAFVNAAIAAADAVGRRCGCSVEARVVTGPFYRWDVRVPASSPVEYTVTGYVPPTHSLYWGTSVVVAQSGYNTFQELGRSGIPHVLVPSGEFGVDDQRRRAASRTEEADVQVVECDPVAIAKAIEHVIAAPRRNEWPTPAGAAGASQIAAAIASMAGVGG